MIKERHLRAVQEREGSGERGIDGWSRWRMGGCRGAVGGRRMENGAEQLGLAQSSSLGPRRRKNSCADTTPGEASSCKRHVTPESTAFPVLEEELRARMAVVARRHSLSRPCISTAMEASHKETDTLLSFTSRARKQHDGCITTNPAVHPPSLRLRVSLSSLRASSSSFYRSGRCRGRSMPSRPTPGPAPVGFRSSYSFRRHAIGLRREIDSRVRAEANSTRCRQWAAGNRGALAMFHFHCSR